MAANGGASSSSTAITDMVNGVHRFFISGCSSLRDTYRTGEYVPSVHFIVGGYTWQVRLYPNGKDAEDSEFISVYAVLASEAHSVRASFEFSLIDRSGMGRDAFRSTFGVGLEDMPKTLEEGGSMWGFSRFCMKYMLDVPGFLKDDTLEINCKIGVVRSRVESPDSLSISVPESDIGQQFGKLLEYRLRTDIYFEVGGDIFAAHRLILAARSPLFRLQLQSLRGDNYSEAIILKDIKAPVFKALLHFIYHDALLEVEDLAISDSKSASTFMFQHLLVAADKYGIPRLVTLCASKLWEYISADTIATTLALADQHHCPLLKSKCLQFLSIPHNLQAMIQTDMGGFDHLTRSCPQILTEILEIAAQLKPTYLSPKPK